MDENQQDDREDMKQTSSERTGGTERAEQSATTPPVPEIKGMRLRSVARILADDPDALESPAVVAPRVAFKGRVTLLSAREKSGKSTLASAVAAAVTTGSRFLDGSSGTGLVVWLKLEETDGDLVRRVIAFGADGERLVVGDRVNSVPESYARMVHALRPALVVVDTLTDWAALHEAHPQSGDSAGWNRIIAELREPARSTGAAVLVLHHQAKKGGARDSTAITGSVDLVLEMTEQKNGDRHIASRGRWDTGDFTIRLEGDRFALIDAAVGLADQIVRFLSENGPSSKSAIRAAVSGRNARIDEELESLLAEGRVVEVRSGTRHPTYAVPDAEEAAA